MAALQMLQLLRARPWKPIYAGELLDVSPDSLRLLAVIWQPDMVS